MKKSKIIILLLVMAMILAVSAASAADVDDSSDLATSQEDSVTVEADDSSDEVLTTTEIETLAEPGDGDNFTSLRDEINIGGRTELTLTKNYTRVSGDSDIEIDKDFTINGANTYTINANNLGGIFKVTSGHTLTLIGVTLKNGNADNGGAVYVENGAKLEATDVIFDHNIAKEYDGGAIYTVGGEIALTDCVLDRNDVTKLENSAADNHGGAAIYAKNAVVTLTNTNVTNNGRNLNRTNGDLSNAVLNLLNSDATITGSLFKNNTGIYGGAVYFEGAKKLNIIKSNFTSNEAYCGAAVQIEGNANFNISDCLFDENNKASGIGSPGYAANGGAIYVSGCEGTIKDITVKNSHAKNGGALDIQNSNVDITGSTFENNDADAIGGVIYAYGACDIKISDSTFKDNHAGATSWAGAIYLYGNSALNITESEFIGNTAGAGTIVTTAGTSHVYINANFTDNTDNYDWGVITIRGTGDVTIEGSNFTKQGSGNTSDVYVNSASDVTIKDSTFNTNSNNAIVAKAGTLDLENNTMTSAKYPINSIGTSKIVSEMRVDILNHEEVTAGESILITANVTDDNLNPIRSLNFKFTINNEQVDAVYNASTGLYEHLYNFETCGVYPVNIVYEGNDKLLVLDATVISNKGTYTDLQYKINHTYDELELHYNFTYNEAIDGDNFPDGVKINKELRILGNGYTISGNNSHRIFRISKNVILDNVTLINGYAYSGGAISAVFELGSHGYLSIINSKLINNTADTDGGAIFVSQVEVVIDHTDFINNTAGDSGGAAAFTFARISNSTFTGNKAHGTTEYRSGGGALVIDYYAEIKDSLFEGNEHDLNGGAIFTFSINTYEGAYVELENNNFISNKAIYGAAIYCISTIYANTARGNNFTGNNASRDGTIYVDRRAKFTSIESNFITDDSAYAIYNEGTLILEGNKVPNYIFNDGTISSKVINATLLNNQTISKVVGEVVMLNATLTDDNGNAIHDPRFNITAKGAEIEIVNFDDAKKVYTSEYVIREDGQHVISTSYNMATEVNIGIIDVIRIGTYTDLQYQIDHAENGVLNLPYNFTYDLSYDGDNFPEGVLITSPITINGNGYTISGNNSYRIFKISAETTLNNINFINGKLVKSNAVGGAISASADLTVDGCNFSDNNVTAGAGGAIHSNNAKLTILNSNFNNNTAKNGAAVYHYAYNGANLTVEGTNFTNNVAHGGSGQYGGALVYYVGKLTDGVATISDSKFINNTANPTGSNAGAGALYLWSANKAVITNSEFIGNNGTRGAAIFYRVGGTVEGNLSVVGCNFTDNDAAVDGEAIYLLRSSTKGALNAAIKDSNFTGNGALTDYAIYNQGTLSLNNNAVDNIIYNGGIIASQVNSTVLGNGTYDIAGNTYDLNATLTDFDGNKIYDSNFKFTVNGEVIDVVPDYNAELGLYNVTYTINSNERIFVVNVTSDKEENLVTKYGILRNITGTYTDLQAQINKAIANGGNLVLPYNFTYTETVDGNKFPDGVVIDKDLNITGNGFTISGNGSYKIFKITSNVVLDNITFVDGKSDNGGAISVEFIVGQSSSLLLNNSKFINNTATTGGAVYASGPRITIDNTEFINNTASSNGGAAFLSRPQIFNSNFTGNKAHGSESTGGGALAIENNAKIVNSRFEDNEHDHKGGAIYTGYISNIELEDNSFINNKAEYGSAIYYNFGSEENKALRNNFTGNNATINGTVYVSSGATLNSTGSNFITDNSTYAIYNLGTLKLKDNKVPNVIYNGGNIIMSIVNATLLNNQTINKELNDVVMLNATLTDDKGNAIYDPSFKISAKGTEIATVNYDNAEKVYTSEYVIREAGQHVISTNYNMATEVHIGIINVARIETVLTVNVENIIYGKNATVEVTLKDVKGNNLNGTVTVVINNKPYTIIVENGMGSINNVSGLAAKDNYLANATIEAFGNYTGANASDLFNVSKATSKVNMSSHNATYPNALEVLYYVVNLTEVSISVVDSNNNPVPFIHAPVDVWDGEIGIIKITDVPAGVYNFTVVNADGENFTGSSYSALFEIYKATNNSINVTAVGATYPGNVTVTVTADVTGRYVVKVGGQEIPVDLVAGVAQVVNVTGLAASETPYVVNVTYDSTDNYTAAFNDTVTVSVSKGTPVINVTAVGAVYPGDVIVTVTSDVAGMVTVTVGDKEVTELVEAGVAHDFTISGLAANDSYVITATLPASENYTVGVNNTETVSVSKGTPVINVTAVGAVYPGDVIVTVTSDVAGMVTVTVGDKEVTELVEAGVAHDFTISGLAANDSYVITATLPASENYTVGVNNTETVSVSKGTPVINVTAVGAVYPGDVIVTVTSDVAGTYVVKVGGKEVPVVLEANVAQVVNVTGLAANETGYVVNVTYDSTDNYTAAFNDTVTVKVMKATITITPEIEGDLTAFNSFNIVFTLPEDVDGIVKVFIDDIALHNIVKSGSKYTAETNGWAVGDYTVYVKLINDTNYNNATGSLPFHVDKASSTIKIIDAPVQIAIGENATVSFEITPELLNNNVTLWIDGVEYLTYVFDENIAKFNITADNFPEANRDYNITVQFRGNSDYNASNNASCIISVVKADVALNIEGSTVVYGNNATVTVTGLPENAEGTVNVTIEGVGTFSADVHGDAPAVINITGLAAGAYENLVVKYSGDGRYNANTGNADVYVNQAKPVINVTAVNATYPGDVVVTVTSDVAGNITVTIGNKQKNESVEAGVPHEFVISGLNATEIYEIIAVLPASQNYTEGINDTEIVSVMKATITIDLVIQGDLYADNNFNVTFALPKDIDENCLNIALDGDNIESYQVVDGVYTVSLSLPLGNYTFTVNLTDDNNYNNANASTVLNIKINTTVEINVTQPTAVGDNATVSVIVPKEAGGNVTVTLSNGTNYTVPVDENGTAKVNIPNLPPGDNEVTITYTPENDAYSSKTSSYTIHVKKMTIIVTNMTRGYNSGMDYQAKLVDEDGSPIENRTLAFTINGKQYNATTDANGIAKINPVLAVGKYDVNVSCPDVGNVSGTVNIVKRTVASDLVMDYRDGSKYKVLVIGDDGNPVGEGVEIEIRVNGITYKQKTDKNGYAYLIIRLIPKTYEITSQYKGDVLKKKVTVKQTLKVKKTVKVKKSAKKLVLKATLKWSNGKAIKGKKIVFKFKGKKYTAKTNKKGVAKVTIKKKVIKKLKKGKKYKYSAWFVKEYAYGKVKVKK